MITGLSISEFLFANCSPKVQDFPLDAVNAMLFLEEYLHQGRLERKVSF